VGFFLAFFLELIKKTNKPAEGGLRGDFKGGHFFVKRFSGRRPTREKTRIFVVAADQSKWGSAGFRGPKTGQWVHFCSGEGFIF